MNYIKRNDQKQTVTLAESITCKILDTNSIIQIPLEPEDWDRFWEVWHAHKKALKERGLYVFMRNSVRGPVWKITITRRGYADAKNTT